MVSSAAPKTTPTADIETVVRDLRQTFDSGVTRPAHFRVEQLKRLKAMIVEREADIFEAVRQDMRKSTMEGFLSETGVVLTELNHTIKNLASWLRPERVSSPLTVQPGSSAVHREPLGVVLIIGAWNYPFHLVAVPLIGAIAAGNCAVVKPSEVAPHTSALVAKLVEAYLDPRAFRVVEGAVPEATTLLEQRFDHIFFTGGAKVGKIVMTAAAKHLTPVTLELGGKSPCIVDERADMETTASRLAWGRFFNGGQTCVAPDYVLVHRSRHDELIEALKKRIRWFWGADPKSSPDLTRIINRRHFDRLAALLGDGEIVIGGDTDPEALYIAPTILTDVSPDSAVMTEEIFGPILPVMPVESLDEAINFINARPKPLVLYLFSKDKKVHRRVIQSTSSGDMCINDTLTQMAVLDLPFGGVGVSGLGAYHGRHSFETFSHRKGVLTRSHRLDPPVRYPPYSETKLKWARRFL